MDRRLRPPPLRSAESPGQRAWSLLLQSVYSAPRRASSPIVRAPSLDGGSLAPQPYDKARLAEAWRELVRASDDLGKIDTFRFDLVNVGRQALANRTISFHCDLTRAWKAKDRTLLKDASQRLLDLIRDLDDLLAMREEFLLGNWLEDAKRWGDDDAQRANLEWNARKQITLWGEWNGYLRDYAGKEWSGMLSGFYAQRGGCFSTGWMPPWLLANPSTLRSATRRSPSGRRMAVKPKPIRLRRGATVWRSLAGSGRSTARTAAGPMESRRRAESCDAEMANPWAVATRRAVNAGGDAIRRWS